MAIKHKRTWHVRVLAVISPFLWMCLSPAQAETVMPAPGPGQLTAAFASLNAPYDVALMGSAPRPIIAPPARAPKRRYFRSNMTLPLTGDPARFKVSGLRWRMETNNLQLNGRLTDLKVSARYKIPW
eukprot:s1_g2493.t1